MALVEVTFQIPLKEDETIGTGTRHTPIRWRALLDVLYQEFSGWTDAGKTRGMWADAAGKPVFDKCRVFKVDVPEERLGEMRMLLRRACHTFAQQCIRAVIRGESEYIAREPDDEPL